MGLVVVDAAGHVDIESVADVVAAAVVVVVVAVVAAAAAVVAVVVVAVAAAIPSAHRHLRHQHSYHSRDHSQ